ncbi:MAG TPA: diaminopimelate epimerase, partial [Clostridiales bacterium]|nr:diaminopimelate epimerase [Clostridiales bacterium]
DLAEDREKFDALLEKLGIKRPKGFAVHTESEAIATAEAIGYPVLLRPSYVIGGQNMRIVYTKEETERYMRRIFSEGVKNSVLIDKYMSGTELEVDVISDGENVLIPGVMEHVERAGVHSGDSIAVYPPYNLNDKMMKTIVDSSVSLAKSLGTKGLVNIQYLIYGGELYVIEVNPRASRTVPYISKITGVPMADVASEVMLGKKLTELPYGTGLYKTPPYYAVKVPVFSFEKLSDVNSYLGPEMKSTGEVLGLGVTLEEALFKGLTSAGMVVRTERGRKQGVLLSADTHDQREIVGLAKKFIDLGFKIYATPETAETVKSLGESVTVINSIKEKGGAYELMENKKISYVVYTGALSDETTMDYIALHRKALALSVPCFTSLDTANALTDVIKARYNLFNTELVDINHMRQQKTKVTFSKMEATGDDYIFIDNRDGKITCPESLCIKLCSRHYGIGGYGIVLIENSKICDVKMTVYNKDGSIGSVAGNSIRSVGKFVYDEGIVDKENITVEMGGRVCELTLYTRFGKVNYVSAHMGKPEFNPENIPCTLPGDKIVDYPYVVGGEEYKITCLSLGNPHCVVFVPSTDGVDVQKTGPLFENADIFPERTNTEFVRVVNENTIKMRVYERGNGETYACGSGACAAVVAATELGYLKKGRDVTVKVKGGDLQVNYSDDGLTLSGDTVLVYKGEFEF